MRTLISILLFVASATCVGAQTVTGLQNISFGNLFRSQTATVAPSSGSAARFRITGLTLARVRITVSKVNLNHSGKTLPISVDNDDCEYSTDGGSTWAKFTTGTLIQDTHFPWSPNFIGTIDVRVGGSVTSGATQQRGTYTGTVSVNAVYH
jgi:hypothetical protein